MREDIDPIEPLLAHDGHLVAFCEDDDHQLNLHLDPATPEDAARVANLDELFGLSRFWGRTVYPGIQQITGVVTALLEDGPRPLSEQTVRRKLQQQAAIFTHMIGTWGLAIPQSYLCNFVAANEALVGDIQRECNAGAEARQFRAPPLLGRCSPAGSTGLVGGHAALSALG